MVKSGIISLTTISENVIGIRLKKFMSTCIQ